MRFLLLTTALGGRLATTFAHAVFDIFAARFTRLATTALTHTITPSPGIVPQVSVYLSFYLSSRMPMNMRTPAMIFLDTKDFSLRRKIPAMTVSVLEDDVMGIILVALSSVKALR